MLSVPTVLILTLAHVFPPVTPLCRFHELKLHAWPVLLIDIIDAITTLTFGGALHTDSWCVRLLRECRCVCSYLCKSVASQILDSNFWLKLY